MNGKLKNVIAFVSGAVSGAFGAIIFVKLRWQKSFEAKREEMISYYKNKNPLIEDKQNVTESKEVLSESSECKKKNDAEMKEEASNIIHRFNYSKISDTSERTKNTSPILNDTEYSDMPYEIDSREFGSNEMYGMVTLYLYDDGEVRTDKQELLEEEDVENYISSKMLEKLANLRDSDPDMDSFYVRNDLLRTDYEILIESGRYSE